MAKNFFYKKLTEYMELAKLYYQHIRFFENMKQICDGYNPKVLMGNWFEQSYAVPQPARQQPTRVPRGREPDISFIDNKGKLRQLNTVSRLQPWNTSNLVETSAHRQMQTSMKQNYDLKTVKNYHQSWKPQPFCKEKARQCNQNHKSYVQLDKFKKQHHMFNEINCQELLRNRPSDEQSFKSQIKPNRHVNQKELLQSIYTIQMSQQAPFFLPYMKQTTDEKKTKNLQTATKLQGSEKQREKNFRRIRSEITLKTTNNFPFTYK